MSQSSNFPREYRIPVSQDHIRSIKNPHAENISVIHAFVKVCDLPNGKLPDKINPRYHEDIKLTARIPEAITETLEDDFENFHLLNRGCLILAKKAWYDNQEKILHFLIESEEEHGLVDGATTDRVLAKLKEEVSNVDFYSLKPEEIPERFKQAYIHLEVIAGDISDDLRRSLARARNTSNQVKEFSMEDLGRGYDWLKEVLDGSAFKDKIRFRENDPKPVDIRTVLALLTLFHPTRWQDSDPIVAYTGKGAVLGIYQDEETRKGYEKLAPVVLDILKLYEYIHVKFPEQYKCTKSEGTGAKLGRLKEVRYISNAKKAKVLPLTGTTTQYVIPDGWLYPLLASFRVLLLWPKSGRGEVKWVTDPFKYFDQNGAEQVRDIIEQSEELGRNPNAAGKSRRLWRGLRQNFENKLLKEQSTEAIKA